MDAMVYLTGMFVYIYVVHTVRILSLHILPSSGYRPASFRVAGQRSIIVQLAFHKFTTLYHSFVKEDEWNWVVEPVCNPKTLYARERKGAPPFVELWKSIYFVHLHDVRAKKRLSEGANGVSPA